jgi:hypothetical protein
MMVVEGRFLIHSLQAKTSRKIRCTNVEDLLNIKDEYCCCGLKFEYSLAYRWQVEYRDQQSFPLKNYVKMSDLTSKITV